MQAEKQEQAELKVPYPHPTKPNTQLFTKSHKPTLKHVHTPAESHKQAEQPLNLTHVCWNPEKSQIRTFQNLQKLQNRRQSLPNAEITASSL